MWLVEAALPVQAQRWTEEEGRREFTGKMVVRPLQVEHWMERGFSRQRAEELYAEATAYTARAVGEYVYRYFERMDEYWFNVPQGRTENDLGEELIATRYYRYVCPNWKTYPSSSEILMNECPNDALLDNQWHLKRIETCAAWQIQSAGDDLVVLGICDAGMRLYHEDLQNYRQEAHDGDDQLWESENGYINRETAGAYCHGTSVLGIAAANGNNSVGVSGIGWSLRHRMLCSDGTTDHVLHTLWVSAGVGDRVLCSTSGDDFTDSETWALWADNSEKLRFYYPDLIIVHTAGNTYDWDYPDFPDMIIVGGTDHSDERWLNQNSGSPVGEFIDLMAPAVLVYATKCSSNTAYGYAYGSGTSYAAPQVAGLCALIWSFDPNFDSEDVESFLFAGCDPIVDYNPDLHGHGRINAFNSLALASGELWTRDPAPGEAGVTNKFKAAGAANGATVRFYYGSATGQTAVSGCSNVYVGIADASVLGESTAGSNGAAVYEASVPGGWRGQTRYLQAVDLSDCRVSNLIELTFPN